MIKVKYFEENKSFFKYFEKYYINEKKFKIEFWNILMLSIIISITL